MFFRSNDDSYSRGVLTEKAYLRGKKRSIISLQMCFMGWLYELLAILSAILSPILKKTFGIPNTHWFDAIIMFVAIPFCHLMNDEETKGIISEENWYEGLRHMLGIYIEKPPQNLPQALPQPPKQNIIPLQSYSAGTKHRTSTTSTRNKVLTRQYNSMTCLLPSKTSKCQNLVPLKRRHSLTEIVIRPLSISIEAPICTSIYNPIKTMFPE